ncbi:MAG: hypothetical protein IJO27_01765 [Bacilli bacterium]|nr:hypothetical protein [Bacilli bacterium]
MIEEVKDLLSLCVVLPENNLGVKMLHRIADIINDKLIYPHYDEYESKSFGNREYLYLNDYEDFEPGFVGVWKWSAIHSFKDYNKDYVTTEYVSDVKPIEIVELNDARNIENLVEILKDGFKFQGDADKYIFVTNEKKSCSGVLVNSKDLAKTGNSYILSTDEIKLPIINIGLSDTILVEDGNTTRRRFHKYVRDIPSSIYFDLKTPHEIIRDLIVKEISWPTLKNEGYTREIYKKVREFLSNYNFQSINQKVVRTLDCSEEMAQLYIDDYINNIDNFINANTFGDQLLINLYERSKEFRERCALINEDNWKKSNQSKIEIAEAEVEAIVDEYRKYLKKVDDLLLQIKELETDIAKCEEKKIRQNQINADLEASVKDKIIEAKAEFGKFLGELSIMASINEQSSGSYVEKQIESISSYTASEFICNNAEENETWKDTIELLFSELLANGIENDSANDLSALLYFAFLNKISLLLSGPFSETLANALSMSINGRKVAILDCSNNITNDELTMISKEKILYVKNVFNSSFKDSIIEKLNSLDVFCIYSHPFSEDLKIESKDLLNYMLPVFTENLFVSKPKNTFIGGICADDYEVYKHSKTKRMVSNRMYSRFNISKFVMNELSTLLTDVKNYLNIQNDTFEFKFLLYPIAYICNKESLLVEMAQDKKIDSEFKEFLMNMLGD